MKSSSNSVDMATSTQDTHPLLAPAADHRLEKLHAKLLQHQPVGGDLVAEEDRPHQSVMPAKGAVAALQASHAFKEEEDSVARATRPPVQASRPTTSATQPQAAGDMLVSPAVRHLRPSQPQRPTQPTTGLGEHHHDGTDSANSSKCPSPTTSTKGTPAGTPNGAPDFREPMKNIGPLMSEAILSTPPMRSSPAFLFPMGSQTRPATTAPMPAHTRLPPAAQRVSPARAFVNPNKNPAIQGELCRRLEWEDAERAKGSVQGRPAGRPMARAEVAAGMDRPASTSSVSSFQTASSVSRESSLRTAGDMSTVSAPAISSVMLAQRQQFGQRSNTSRSEPDAVTHVGQAAPPQAVHTQQPPAQPVQAQQQPSVRDAVRQLRIQAPATTGNSSGVVYDRRPSLGSTLFGASGLIGTPSQPGAGQHQRVGSGASSPQRHIVVDVLAALNSPFHIPNGAASPPFSDYAGMASPVRLTPGPNGVYLLQSQPVVLTPQPFPATPSAFPHIPGQSPHPPAGTPQYHVAHQAAPHAQTARTVAPHVQQPLPAPTRSPQQHVRQPVHQPPAMVTSHRSHGTVPAAPSSSSGMSATASGTSAPTSRDEVHIPEGLLRDKMTEFEWNMIRIMEKTLRHEGPITVGRMGSVLHQRTKQHLLPKLFKHQFGGLKKFVQRHYWRFELESDHPFNPTLRLRDPPQEARPMPYSMLVHMEPASFNGALDTEALQECEVDELEIIKLSASVIREFPNVTIGRMGTLLHSRTQNHRLPRIMKAKFGGLKKFYEMHSDIFHVGEDHPFNPQLALRRDWKRRLQQKAQTLPAQRAREKREREVQEMTGDSGMPSTPQRPLRPHNISIGRAMPEGMNFMSPIRETPRDMTNAFERAVLPPPQQRRANPPAQRPSHGQSQQQQGEFVPSRVVLVDDSGRPQQSFAFQDFVNAVKTDRYGRPEQEPLRQPQRGHQQEYAEPRRNGGEEAWFEERMARSGPSRNVRQGRGSWQGQQQSGGSQRGMRVVQKHSSGWRTSEVVSSSQDVYSEGRQDGAVSRRTNAGRRAFAAEHAPQQQSHAPPAVATATQAQASGAGGQVGAGPGAAGGVYARSGWPGRMGSDTVTRYGLQH